MLTPNPTQAAPGRRSRVRGAGALLAAAALAAPAVALASGGADDPAGHDTATPSAAPAPATRAQAIAATRARVGDDTRLLRAERKHGRRVAWEVRLRSATRRFTVTLERGLDVVRVERERLHHAAAADDGTPDQGTGEAGTAAGAAQGGTDDPAGHDAADDHGTTADDTATHDAGDDHHGSGGSGGGHGSDG